MSRSRFLELEPSPTPAELDRRLAELEASIRTEAGDVEVAIVARAAGPV